MRDLTLIDLTGRFPIVFIKLEPTFEIEIDYILTPSEKFFSYIMVRINYLFLKR